MMNDKLDLMAKREDWSNGISLYARVQTSNTSSIAKPLLFVEQTGGFHVEPFIRMEIAEAQKLMDELWHCGLRPSEGTGSAGSLAATQKHLEDFRKIAFKGLDIEPGK